MNRYIYCMVIVVWISGLTRSIQINGNFVNITTEEQQINKKDIKTSVTCNKTSLVVNFSFKQPFNGIIYANQIFSTTASRCRSYGNGSEVIHFVTNIHECGVKYTANHETNNGLNETYYELVLYVQNDRNIQQGIDEYIEVKCWPQEVVGNERNNQTNTKLSAKSLYGATYVTVQRSNDLTLTDITDSVECRMDVMKGRLPFLKPIDSFVDLGQDVTVLIKIKEINGIDSMISRCYAHEGSHVVKQELTNSDGCSIDANILPNFQLMSSPPSDFKVYFTTFPAFKFPDKTNLNIQCTVILCNTTCPQMQCDNTKARGITITESRPALHRIKRLTLASNVNKTIIIERKLMANNYNKQHYHHWDWDLGDTLDPIKLQITQLNINTPINATLQTALTDSDGDGGRDGGTHTNHHHLSDNENHKIVKTFSSIHEIYIKKFGQRCLTSQYLMLTFIVLILIALLAYLCINCYGIRSKLKHNNQLKNHKLVNHHYLHIEMHTNK